MTLLSTPWTMKGMETQYICQKFDLGNTVRHITAIEAVYNVTGNQYVHHIQTYLCGAHDLKYPLVTISYDATPCMEPKKTHAVGVAPMFHGSCTTYLSNWEHGVGPIIFPNEAGFRIGDTHRYLVVEIHLDDTSKQAKDFVIENIGITIHTTTKLRKFDANTLTLGDLLSHGKQIGKEITGKTSNYHFEATCIRECTKKLTNELIIF